MPTPFWTRVVVGLAAGVWIVIAFVLDVPVDDNWLKALGIVAAVVVLALLAFDRVAWRWLPSALTRRPKLHGTWKATINYEWPAGTPQSKDCFIVVRQTYSTVSVGMLFDISSSQSRSAAIVSSDGRRHLWFSYWSAADAQHREDNPPHRGAAELVVSAKPRTRLEGDYWTDRKTLGRIATSGHSKTVYDDYQSAQAGTYK